MSQQINLYDSRLRPQHELASARNLGVAAALLLTLMTALSLQAGFAARQKSALASAAQTVLLEEQDKLATLSKDVAQRELPPLLKSELEMAKTMLTARKEALDILESGTLGNGAGFSALMSGFARQTQPDLWLTGFSLSAGGAEIEIRGRTLDPAKLPAYVQRLSAEPVFQGRRFAALEMRGVDAEAPEPDQPGGSGAADALAQPPPVLKLPRFAEFVLRSDHAYQEAKQ